MGNVSNRVLYIISLNHATNDGSVYLLSSLFPIVLSLFDVSVFQVGIIVAVGYTVNVLFQPVVGHFSEGKDPGKFLATGMVFIAVSAVSFIFSTGFLSLLASVVVLRLGSSFFHPVGISAVSKTYNGPGLQRAMGFQSAFGNLGVLLTFVSAAPLYLAVGWRSTFLVFAIWTIVDIITTLRLLGPRNLANSGSSNRASESVGSTRIPAFYVIVAFVSGGSYAVVLNFANIFLGSKTQLNVSQVNLIVSAFIGFAFLGALATGSWSRVLPTNVLLAVFYLIASAAMTGFVLLAGNVLEGAFALVATGFAMSSTYPLTYTSLSNFLSSSNHQRTGESFGVLSSGQTIGASSLGLVSGYVSQFFGLEAAFLMIAVLTVVGSFSTVIWIRRSRTKGL